MPSCKHTIDLNTFAVAAASYCHVSFSVSFVLSGCLQFLQSQFVHRLPTSKHPKSPVPDIWLC